MSALAVETKRCTKCGKTKPIADFHRQRNGGKGRQAYCKPCISAYRSEWDANNPDRRRAKYRKHDLKRSFGISVEQYDEMLTRQGGACKICRKACKSGRRLAVDHDHVTGQVRGLLCGNCNRGIGCFLDNPQLLNAAIKYLEGGDDCL